MQLSLFKLCLACGGIILRKGHRHRWGVVEFENRMFCSKSCARKGVFVSESAYRKRTVSKKKKNCERCGVRPKDSKKLHQHHVDGHVSNTADDNLVTLCERCHRIEHRRTGTGMFWATRR